MNRFFIGYKYPTDTTSVATIYFDGMEFGACWIIKDWDAKYEGKIAFIRWKLALDSGCPIIEPSDSIENLLEKLNSYAPFFRSI